MALFSLEARKRAQVARTTRAEARKAEGLPVTRTPLERLAETPTRGNAIKAMCYDCQGRDADPAVKWRIGNCTCVECPLYQFRPHQRLKGKPIPAALAIA